MRVWNGYFSPFAVLCDAARAAKTIGRAERCEEKLTVLQEGGGQGPSGRLRFPVQEIGSPAL